MMQVFFQANVRPPRKRSPCDSDQLSLLSIKEILKAFGVQTQVHSNEIFFSDVFVQLGIYNHYWLLIKDWRFRIQAIVHALQ